jgi:hypothetical protein
VRRGRRGRLSGGAGAVAGGGALGGELVAGAELREVIAAATTACCGT